MGVGCIRGGGATQDTKPRDARQRRESSAVDTTSPGKGLLEVTCEYSYRRDLETKAADKKKGKERKMTSVLCDTIPESELRPAVATMVWDRLCHGYAEPQRVQNPEQMAGEHIEQILSLLPRPDDGSLSRAFVSSAVDDSLVNSQKQQSANTGEVYDVASEYKVQAYQSTDKGSRHYMEDMTICVRSLPKLFGTSQDEPPGLVFSALLIDGHGGSAAAEYTREHFPSTVIRHPSFCNGDLRTALLEGFAGVDQEFNEKAETYKNDSGCCAVAAIFTGDTVTCANIGDCRAVVGQFVDHKMKAVSISTLHTLMDETEREAVQERGGRLQYDGCLRVEGMQITRSIGDRKAREFLSQVPAVHEHRINPAVDEFVVLGSDGLFEVLSDTFICEFVHNAKFVIDDLIKLRLAAREIVGIRPLVPRGLSFSHAGKETLDGSAKSSCSQSGKSEDASVAWSFFSMPESQAKCAKLKKAHQMRSAVTRTLHEIITGKRYEASNAIPETLSVAGMLDTVPSGEDRDRILEDIATSAEYAALCDYQHIVDGLVGEVLTTKKGLCDNVSCIVVFLDSVMHNRFC